MNISEKIEQSVIKGAFESYGAQLAKVEFVPTRKDFEGDTTGSCFFDAKAYKRQSRANWNKP